LFSSVSLPLATKTARRFEVSLASQSNVPPSKSGRVAPSAAVTHTITRIPPE
jgi:hypothetical protein